MLRSLTLTTYWANVNIDVEIDAYGTLMLRSSLTSSTTEP